MSDQASLTRRGVLWLLAAGSGTTLLGNQLPEQPPPGWEMKVNIEGCPLSSASVQSFELGESVFAPPRGKSRRDVDFRASLRLSGEEGVRKEIETWFADATFRFIGVAVQSEDGAVRTFNLIDCFPTRWSTTEYSPSSTTKLETIVVKIGRVEFA